MAELPQLSLNSSIKSLGTQLQVLCCLRRSCPAVALLSNLSSLAWPFRNASQSFSAIGYANLLCRSERSAKSLAKGLTHCVSLFETSRSNSAVFIPITKAVVLVHTSVQKLNLNDKLKMLSRSWPRRPFAHAGMQFVRSITLSCALQVTTCKHYDHSC